jgi:hypothetical protein
VVTLASDYGFGFVNTDLMGPEENTREAFMVEPCILEIN